MKIGVHFTHILACFGLPNTEKTFSNFSQISELRTTFDPKPRIFPMNFAEISRIFGILPILWSHNYFSTESISIFLDSMES